MFSSGSALVTLSTIVTFAERDVRDNGFRSTAITFFPILRNADARSPSSSGTNTTSASPIPDGSIFRRMLSKPGTLLDASLPTPRTRNAQNPQEVQPTLLPQPPPGENNLPSTSH